MMPQVSGLKTSRVGPSSKVKYVPQAKSSMSLKLSQACLSSLNIVINYSFDIMNIN